MLLNAYYLVPLFASLFLFFVFIIFMVRKREYAEELNILRNEFLVIGSRSAAGRASSFDGVTFRSEESP